MAIFKNHRLWKLQCRVSARLLILRHVDQQLGAAPVFHALAGRKVDQACVSLRLTCKAPEDSSGVVPSKITQPLAKAWNTGLAPFAARTCLILAHRHFDGVSQYAENNLSSWSTVSSIADP